MAIAIDPVFDLQNVSYEYGRGHVALAGVDLRIEQGERVVLLGANGSGKSTLLKIMDGLYPASGGTISAFGRPMSELANDLEAAYGFHRRVGLVFQDPDVQLFSPTVGDDVAFGPLQLRLPLVEVRRRVEAALTKMDIMHLRDRAPFELSGGEKKRASIASVLSLEPEVILLDEPTASLDPRTKWVLINLILALANEGKTLVVSTHELEIVPIIAERVVVLGENRKVIADGPTAEIMADEHLLIEANLIHEHLHRHAEIEHSHPHLPIGEHHHEGTEVI